MLLESAEYIGIAAFSASGFYIGKRNDLDLLGIYIASFLTALGGGLMRDLILGRVPVSFSETLPSLIVIVIVTTLIFLHRFYHHDIDSKPQFVLIDAVGMVSFAISGAILALQHHFNLAGVSISAFITATGGGIFRDILINQVPYILKGGFYGIVAIVIGITIYLLNVVGVLNTFTIVMLFFSGIVLRMTAYSQAWHLPRL
jgi:uncharacterized membrane protein YeiH